MWNLVTCVTLLRQTRVKIQLETSQELGVEVRVVLGEVIVGVRIVMGVMDVDKEARTITTKRNCLPGVTQQKNWDRSSRSRNSLC